MVQVLKESELRYRRLFEAAQDGILILDAKTGMIEDVNPYLINMLGYSRPEFVKKSSGRSVHFEILKPAKRPSKLCKRMNIFATMIYRSKRKAAN
jgi:PAS domain S-box-containing protein